MEYKVTCKKGIKYLDPAQQIVILKEGSTIRQADIDNKFFTVGGLERLEKDGRVKKVGAKEVAKEEEKVVEPDPLNGVISPKNKKMKKGKEK